MILPTPRSDVLIRRYAVVAYLLLTMAMGTGTITLVVRNYFPGGAALKAATSASASGIFLTALTKGIAGLKLLFSQLFIWRVGIANWFFAALLIIPIIFLGSLFNPIFNGDAPKLSKFELGFDWILMYLSFFPVADVSQELGWTGFLMLGSLLHSSEVWSAYRIQNAGLIRVTWTITGDMEY